MNAKSENGISELKKDAQAIVSATGDLAKDAMNEAGRRIAAAKGVSRVLKGAKNTDRTLRAKPYQAVALALGLGALFGFFIGRRR